LRGNKGAYCRIHFPPHFPSILRSTVRSMLVPFLPPCTCLLPTQGAHTLCWTLPLMPVETYSPIDSYPESFFEQLLWNLPFLAFLPQSKSLLPSSPAESVIINLLTSYRYTERLSLALDMSPGPVTQPNIFPGTHSQFPCPNGSLH